MVLCAAAVVLVLAPIPALAWLLRMRSICDCTYSNCRRSICCVASIAPATISGEAEPAIIAAAAAAAFAAAVAAVTATCSCGLMPAWPAPARPPPAAPAMPGCSIAGGINARPAIGVAYIAAAAAAIAAAAACCSGLAPAPSCGASIAEKGAEMAGIIGSSGTMPAATACWSSDSGAWDACCWLAY